MPRTSIVDDRAVAIGRSVITAVDREGLMVTVHSGSLAAYDLFGAGGGQGVLHDSSPDSGGWIAADWQRYQGVFMRAMPTDGDGLNPSGSFVWWGSGLDASDPHPANEIVTLQLCFLLRDNPVQRDIGFLIRGDKKVDNFLAVYARILADQQTIIFGSDVYVGGSVVSSQLGGSSTYPGPLNLTWHWLRCQSSLIQNTIGDAPVLPYTDRAIFPNTQYPTYDDYGIFYRGPNYGTLMAQFMLETGDYYIYVRDVA